MTEGSVVGGSELADLAYDDSVPGLMVLSFDPGVTTGWAVHRLDLSVLVSAGFSEAVWAAGSGWVSGQLGGSEDEVVDQMVDLTRGAFRLGYYPGGDLFAIAMEDFIPRMLEQKRSFLSPVRVYAKYERDLWRIARETGLRMPYVKQSASDAKNVVSDDRLQRWNLWKPGAAHARDAQRHGILLARKFASDMGVRSLVRSGLVLPPALLSS